MCVCMYVYIYIYTVYIYILFYIVKITQRVPFFVKNKHVWILILYNSSINNKLILRDLRFCSISPTKNNSKQLQHCFLCL